MYRRMIRTALPACWTLALVSSTVSAALSQELRLGYVMSSSQNPAEVSQSDGFAEAAKAAGAQVTILSAQGSTEKMTNAVQDLISSGVNGFATGTMDSTVALSWLESAKAAGVPYVSVTQQVGDPANVAFRDVNPDLSALVAEDYTATGHRLALETVSRGMLPKDRQAKIGIVEGQPGFAMVTQLNAGFKAGLDEAGVSYAIVFSQPTDWTPAAGLGVCANGITADPDISVVFTHAEDMAVGCANAIAQAGSNAKIVSAAGGSTVGAPLIRSGEIALSTCMTWKRTGELAAKALVEAAEDPSTAKGRLVETKPELIDATNIDQVCNPQQW